MGLIKRLEMPVIAEMLDEEYAAQQKGVTAMYYVESSKWQCELPHEEKEKMQLARALVINPEVIVLNNAFRFFLPDARDSLLDVVLEYVNNRGWGFPPEETQQRRFRTCIYVGNIGDLSNKKVADVVYHFKSVAGGFTLAEGQGEPDAPKLHPPRE